MKKSSRAITKVAHILGATLAAGLAFITVKELPGIVRYVNMKRMAKWKSGASKSLLPSNHEPQYAQAPRRAGEVDHNRGLTR
jgi:hypothetical protein